MKIIKRELPEDIKKITIIPISDVHIGDKSCNLKAFKEALERIKNEDNTYTILNGDLCNIALKTSKSDTYEEDKTPMEQVLELITYLEPIKDKILVMSSGNHEDRIKRDTNVDILWLVAKQLGIEDRYSPSWWYLYLTFGLNIVKKDRQMIYTITGYHGTGGGSTSGGKINKVKKMSQVVLADIYLMSHVHEPITTKGIIYVPEYQHKTIVKREMYYCISNSFVEYQDSYAERMGLIPSNTGINEIELDGNRKSIKLIL
jgi:hypothetical protein